MGYDTGGMVDPTSGQIGGVTPTSQSMSPTERGMVQKYASLPVEKLQEMAGSMGGSAQGQLIQKVLQQKLAMPTPGAQAPASPPNLDPAAQQVTNAQQGTQPQMAAHGGQIARRADGGAGISASQGMPSWTRTEAAGIDHGASGFLHGSTGGRTDAINTQAPGGSYVIPADVVSGLGEGNSLAGARFMQDAISTGPWGTPLGHINSSAPHVNHMAMHSAAKGGGLAGPKQMPVMLSHGEYVIPPEIVDRIGSGDRKRGIKVLDHFVEDSRAKLIKKLKSLPGPVKS